MGFEMNEGKGEVGQSEQLIKLSLSNWSIKLFYHYYLKEISVHT